MRPGLWFAAAVVAASCAHTHDMEDAALFSAELNLCVKNADTRAAADSCRAQVEQKYCGPDGSLAASAGCHEDGGVQ